MSAKFVAPEYRRWRVVGEDGKPLNDESGWTIKEVVLSDDMSADRAKLMAMKPLQTITGYDGITFERYI